MNDQQSGLPDQLRLKFPNLRPIADPPKLILMNGFGLAVYGKRDYDQETSTYIKTRCICALFIPIFCINAYRVVDAGGRKWYFLGTEPLSAFARSWNAAMALALGFIVSAVV